VGAGPYGLSIAAYLRRGGLLQAILGKPMDFWESMPTGLLLKSPWSASNLADPNHRYTLDRFVESGAREKVEPIPLSMFVDYGHWFRHHAVGPVDDTRVQRVSHDRGAFRLELADGRVIVSHRVVVATGIGRFPYIPEFAGGLPADLWSHTLTLGDPAAFAGRDIAVIGAGQSALESAALLREGGARVELFARGPVRWADRRLHDHTGFGRKIFYPPADVGPVGINWVVTFPRFVRHLPSDVRKKLGVRAVRPSGAKWLKERVEQGVKITAFTKVLGAESMSGRVVVRLDDGSQRRVDHLILGTGYRPDVSQLAFLDHELRAAVVTDGRGYPVLDVGFQCTVPRLHFAGALARGSFGPLCNFVAGARVAARQVGRYAAQGS
jgi:FAD-dependent urate hydroxylase